MLAGTSEIFTASEIRCARAQFHAFINYRPGFHLLPDYVQKHSKARDSESDAFSRVRWLPETAPPRALTKQVLHRTERAGAGVWKLALFYGFLL